MYCYRCGTKFDPDADKFCSKCGASFYPSTTRKKKSIPWLDITAVVVFIVSLSVMAPVLISILFGDCGAIQVGRTLALLETYEDHIIQIEQATIDNVRPPSYLISQIDGDIIALQNTEFDGCVKPAANLMLATLENASIYFSALPVNSIGDDGYPILLSGNILQRKYEYEDILRLYYAEVKVLRTCQPLCNMDSVFQFGKEE